MTIKECNKTIGTHGLLENVTTTGITDTTLEVRGDSVDNFSNQDFIHFDAWLNPSTNCRQSKFEG